MKITLKDGVVKEFDNAVSVLEIAKSISEGLARNACAGIVDGEVKDLRYVVDKDAEVSICTFEDEAGKLAFRHTASHMLAQAVKRLYPEAKIAIGPSISDGFYYDFDREKAFTQEELEALEAEMKKRGAYNIPVNVNSHQLKNAAREQCERELNIVAISMADTLENDLMMPPSVLADYLIKFHEKCRKLSDDPEEFERVNKRLEEMYAINKTIEIFSKQQENGGKKN